MHCRDVKDMESIKKKTLTFHAGLGPKINFGILTTMLSICYGSQWAGIRNPKFVTHKNNVYTKSFFPATIREWNSLPMEVRNSPTLCTFKTRLLKHFPPPVKHIWFNTGNRCLNIHHTRIRLCCSKLKSELHFNLFADIGHIFAYVQIITIKD